MDIGFLVSTFVPPEDGIKRVLLKVILMCCIGGLEGVGLVFGGPGGGAGGTGGAGGGGIYSYVD